ncbi:MAG: deoxyribonuclease V [Pseudomonadales bacterium]|nr:deoxyribonuclease V [Pseudomonadales bacterium]MBI26227.1 deoxyribonuclease V [Pseudomonadales bacterium]MEC8810308.1 deoxyribonuclease V [Pseudomonadota bacterium]HAG94505.1 deoxyribonuclease V [Gammaproteobacteria bacterium]HBO93787.1 deoxyribonuclease V [Gammaproteobacteria bacterium]
MKTKFSHDWELSPDEAYYLQCELSSMVKVYDDFSEINTVAGVDVAYDKEANELVAGIVVIDLDSFDVIDSNWARAKQNFPYVPGLFSFRELPSIIKCLRDIKIAPDLFVCDGQGIAHPRRFGLASHLGVLFDIPSIGCAKTKLLGEFVEPEVMRGAYSYLFDKDEYVGSVLRTQSNVKPVFVSPGHRVSIESSVEYVLKLSPNYRLPETTRMADQLVRQQLKAGN